MSQLVTSLEHLNLQIEQVIKQLMDRWVLAILKTDYTVYCNLRGQ